jgi:DNA helicase HerA-like ATPase
MRDIGLAPERDKPARVRQKQEQFLANIDEFERGYPRLTLSFLIDIVGACLAVATKGEIDPFTPALRTLEGREQLKRRVETRKEMVSTHASSWGKLRSLLYRLNRLQVFDSPPERARPMSYGFLIKPGQVSVLDLSDTGMSQLSNIVIADLLRGIQGAQDQAYQAFERAKARDAGAAPPARVLIIIEEAHEFLSAERIDKMEVLFRQVATIAKRGRKRWLGLVFVTQLPQHLPRQVLGLVNSYILHKITDPQVVSTLRRTVSGIDDSLWTRLPGLAPGQAIVSFPHLARPLLVSVDPTPVKLRLID